MDKSTSITVYLHGKSVYSVRKSFVERMVIDLLHSKVNGLTVVDRVVVQNPTAMIT